jgi:hypothetical protein
MTADHPDKPEAPKKSNRGGRRPGAGRKPKGHVPVTRLAGIDLAAALASPAPDDIAELAQTKAWDSLAAFVKQLMHGESEAAKVTAANAILDRGYGKPAVDTGGDLMLPFAEKPATVIDTAAQLRLEARRYARLAVEVLHKVATAGVSETARISASTSLLDRGLGTVATAKVPTDLREAQRPTGKKEELQRAANAAATGRFAVPPAPRSATVN